MAKASFNQELIDRVTEAVWAAWRLDPKISLSCWPFDETARRAVRRWRGSKRRGVAQDDIEARIRDLAKGIAHRENLRMSPYPHEIRLAQALAPILAASSKVDN